MALHKIEGTFQPVRHGGLVEPEAHGDLAAKPPPGWMTSAQRELWAECLLDAPRDLLRRIDWAVFANYIELVDRHAILIRAQQKLNQDLALPFLIKTSSGIAVSPYLRAINQCVLLMTRLQGEMGFTPIARARFARVETEPDEIDAGWDVLRKLRIIDGGKR